YCAGLSLAESLSGAILCSGAAHTSGASGNMLWQNVILSRTGCALKPSGTRVTGNGRGARGAGWHLYGAFSRNASEHSGHLQSWRSLSAVRPASSISARSLHVARVASTADHHTAASVRAPCS